MEALGIDIGGSAIKGAIVNLKTGRFVGERYRIETSQPPPIEETVSSVQKIVEHFNWKGKIGCGFPAVVQNGIVQTAANIDKAFIGVNANELFTKATGCETTVLNDADVAGYAELKFGSVKDFKGFAIFLTIGTGIGSALFNKGALIPNSELGHIFMKNGLKGEKFTADSARKREKLNWSVWGKRFNEYLLYLDKLFYPELIIVGGGTSKRFDKFENELTLKTRVVPASLQNDAGIIGAALFA
ncbi:MAG: polyphosphate glucokinase [Bacteroidetes bacterium HGW-Bacteroidetes-15]|nr:MAG: polyphosphate glucokinase [Bacteroidetes bacterium HGW-Bacteroidetes-15]